MSATETFSLELLADICATARRNHERSGRGVLFVKPMPDDSARLDSEYFQSCQLLSLDELKETAGYDVAAVAFDQASAYDPDRQCVLVWMGEDEHIYCETIDAPKS